MALSVMRPSTPQHLPSPLDKDMTKTQPVVKGSVSILTSNAWACGRDGQCEIFPHMDINSIEVVVLEPTYRLFRYIQRQPAGRPDHIITWGESRGSGLVVWSSYGAKRFRSRSATLPRRKTKMRFIVPTARNINIALRDRVAHSIDAVIAKPPKRLRSLGYVRVRKVRDDCNEAMWHIVRERKCIELSPACAEA